MKLKNYNLEEFNFDLFCHCDCHFLHIIRGDSRGIEIWLNCSPAGYKIFRKGRLLILLDELNTHLARWVVRNLVSSVWRISPSLHVKRQLTSAFYGLWGAKKQAIG